MKRIIAAAAAAAALAGLAGCGGSGINEAACADALQKVLRGDAPMAKPVECHGISDDRMGELSFHGSPEAADAAATKEPDGPADRQACLDAITTTAQLAALAGGQDTDRPVVCDGMDDDEYTQLYQDAQRGSGS